MENSIYFLTLNYSNTSQSRKEFQYERIVNDNSNSYIKTSET